jgi:hypothetical protein
MIYEYAQMKDVINANVRHKCYFQESLPFHVFFEH